MPDESERLDAQERDGRLNDLERRVTALTEVCAAVADDTLRVCFVFDEMARVGLLPALPWDVATGLVELHHAMQAAKEGLTDGAGVLASQRVDELKADVSRLRDEYRKLWNRTGDADPTRTP